ncbi:Holliday junction resolvase [Rhynchospora pubera]|uniref:Holliday junction resolvase n=1 Tax=Rhynchospora pubera TaxID=906938 RepID=A0AAV8EYQ5_9POAL|nr:Holliday junction resolvase [Rhynchospora pubera]KAJ4784611.1 Holliday junction resolvase [Rhynchospora pubera]
MEFLVRTVPATPSPFHLRGTRTLTRRSFICRSQSRPPPSRGKKRLEPELLPNARRLKHDPDWTGGGFSLGVDFGNVKTGLAVGMSLALPRPLTVLRMSGKELEVRLIELAQKEDADELIVGLPQSFDLTETYQSHKVRAFVRKLAVRAADTGLRVYLQDEHGTSKDALNYMIDIGVKKSARKAQSDAYSAVMVLERYFEMRGLGVELVLPDQPELRQKLKAGVQSKRVDDFWKDDEKSGGNFFGLF